MSSNTSLTELLREPLGAMRHRARSMLAELRPGRHVVATQRADFVPEVHAEDGLAQLAPLADVVIDRNGGPHESGHAATAWYSVHWNGHTLEVLRLAWTSAFGEARHAPSWVVAESEEVARDYLDAVCGHVSDVREEVLVYANGCWNKSPALFRSVREARWEDVVLERGMVERIREEFDRFIGSRADHERWGVPWKRGALFIGPPGNGKTLTIRALVRHLGLPCLYVQTFVSQQETEQAGIRKVFARARELAPCVVVLEDVDSLVTPTSLSFFLNELDGFAANTGIVTLASTNHPERLDPAIVDRPSRFDRKIHFPLPVAEARARYLSQWLQRVPDVIRPDDATIGRLADATDGFSFAYLKELAVSALTRMGPDASRETLVRYLDDEVEVLGRQMKTTSIVPEVRAEPIAPTRRW